MRMRVIETSAFIDFHFQHFDLSTFVLSFTSNFYVLSRLMSQVLINTHKFCFYWYHLSDNSLKTTKHLAAAFPLGYDSFFLLILLLLTGTKTGPTHLLSRDIVKRLEQFRLHEGHTSEISQIFVSLLEINMSPNDEMKQFITNRNILS